MPLVIRLLQMCRDLHQKGKSVNYCWLYRRPCIRGNEKVDSLVKTALNSTKIYHKVIYPDFYHGWLSGHQRVCRGYSGGQLPGSALFSSRGEDDYVREDTDMKTSSATLSRNIHFFGFTPLDTLQLYVNNLT